MEHPTIAVEALRISVLWLLVWLASGLWIQVFLLHRLASLRLQWPLVAIGGMATHMILVLNLSYLGMSVRQGWYLALAAALTPVLLRPLGLMAFLRTFRSAWVVGVFLLLSVAVQSWPLVKEGVLTTAPAENGDWLTYVNHADLLSDFGYGYSAARSDYPQHFMYTNFYETSNFRYGPSHLLASSSVIAGHRAIYIFNVFCGCLIGLVACSIYLLGWQLGIGARPALVLGLLWATHPSVHWVGFAAFMPQLVGVSLMLTLLAICPLLVGRRSKLALGGLMGLLLCGLFVGYNELIPITGATIGLTLLALGRTKRARWKRIVVGSSFACFFAISFSPTGVYRGIQGMILQVELAKRTGGAEQAIDQTTYLAGSWLGVLPLPPTREMISQYTSHPSYALVQGLVVIILIAGLLLFAQGIWRCRRGRLVLLPINLVISVLLAGYIHFTFDLPQFRTWGIFKLTQYALPFAALVIGIGSVRSDRKWKRAALVQTLVIIAAIVTQGLHYFSGFPKSSLHVNQPRYGMLVTQTDLDFVAAVDRIVPAGTPVLAINDFTLVRNVIPPLLLYPRKVLAPETPISVVFAGGTQFAVEDRNFPRVRALAGSVAWENERFSILKLSSDQVYLSLANASARLLGPESEISKPVCQPGESVALHGFAVDGGTITSVVDKPAGTKQMTIELPRGEFIIDVPLSCEAGGAKTILRTTSQVYVSDHELVKDDQRRSRLLKAAEELATQPSTPTSLLPLLGRNGQWQSRRFDGSPVAPAVEFDSTGARISSTTPTSGGLEAVLPLKSGWYELQARLVVPRPIAGSGRGFGVGILSLPESQAWQKEAGTLLLRKLVKVPSTGPRGFGIVLGGFGTVTGEATVSGLELRPAAIPSALDKIPTVPLPPWGDSSWSAIAYDGAKDLSKRLLDGQTMSLTAAQATSSGFGAMIDLEPGTYALGARIEGLTQPTGSGQGYSILVEGVTDSAVSLKEKGTLIGERVFSITKGGKYRLCAIIGGYGLSQGEARFSDIRLKRISGRISSNHLDSAVSIALPSLEGENWRIVPLDPAPGSVDTRRGPGWLGLGSKGQISSAAVAPVKLERGAYMLGAEILAEESAVGNGRGYGVGFLQNQSYQWWVREAGGHRISALLTPEKPLNDTLALIVGGFGTVKGSAVFRRPTIQRLRFSTLESVR